MAVADRTLRALIAFQAGFLVTGGAVSGIPLKTALPEAAPNALGHGPVRLTSFGIDL